MTSTPFKPKSAPKKAPSVTLTQEEETCNRLLDEVRSLHRQLYEVRFEVNKAGPDFDRMSVVGGVQKITKDMREAQANVRKLEKELDKMIKNS